MSLSYEANGENDLFFFENHKWGERSSSREQSNMAKKRRRWWHCSCFNLCTSPYLATSYLPWLIASHMPHPHAHVEFWILVVRSDGHDFLYQYHCTSVLRWHTLMQTCISRRMNRTRPPALLVRGSATRHDRRRGRQLWWPPSSPSWV